MFDRFTDRAKKVINLASREVQGLHHDRIGTEHLLLAIVVEGSGVAASVLKNLSINLNDIRTTVYSLVKPGPATTIVEELPFSSGAQKALELSKDEATNLGHNYIGTEHLLLALIRENEGLAAHVLRSVGVTLEAARERVIEVLGAEDVDECASSTPSNEVGANESTPKAPLGVIVRITRAGHGEQTAANGDGVSVHYRAFLPDGTTFDDSYRRERPLEFVLAERTSYLVGLVDGIRGMKIGEIRDVTAPPELAFGERGAGTIVPPNSHIRWTLELLELDKGATRHAEQVRKVRERQQRLEAEGIRSHTQLLSRLELKQDGVPQHTITENDAFGIAPEGAALIRAFQNTIRSYRSQPVSVVNEALLRTLERILEFEGCTKVRSTRLPGEDWYGVHALRSGKYQLKSGSLEIDERVFVRMRLSEEPVDGQTINHFRGEAVLAGEDHYMMFCSSGFTPDAEQAAEIPSVFHYYLLGPSDVNQWIRATYDSMARPTRAITAKMVGCWKEFIAALARNPALLLQSEWNEVEEILAVAFRALGFEVSLAPMGSDGGKDIILRSREGEAISTYYVQVKHNRQSRVGSGPVKDFVTLCMSEGVTGGMFIASGGFSARRNEIVSRIPTDSEGRIRIALGDRDSLWSVMRASWARMNGGLFRPLPDLLAEVFSDRNDWFRLS